MLFSHLIEAAGYIGESAERSEGENQIVEEFSLKEKKNCMSGF